MRSLFLIIGGLLVLVLVVWFVSRSFNQVFDFTKNPTPTPAGSIVTVTPSPGAKNSPTPSSSGNITVKNPVGSSTVSSPFIVRGSARVFENIVSIELTDNNGNVLYSGGAYANSPDVGQFGEFEQSVQFRTNSASGVLRIFQISAKDGSKMDIVEVPLNFN